MTKYSAPNTTKEIHAVEKLLHNRRLHQLSFQQNGLEDAFNGYFQEHAFQILRQNLLVGLTFSLVYCFFGSFVVPRENLIQWFGLYLAICFTSLLCLFACLLENSQRVQFCVSTAIFLSSLLALLTICFTPANMHTVLVVTALFIYFAAYSSTLISFKWAAISCNTSLFLSLAALKFLNIGFDWKSFLFILIGGNTLGALVCYLNEYLLRKTFLQRYLLLLEKKHLRAVSRRFETQSRIDALTNIANRRFFNLNYKLEWLRCHRNSSPISIIFLDIDYYKKYNDFYGHQVGDECLRNIAQTLDNMISRPGDMVARYGGEEFIVLLPDTDEIGAVRIAEKIQRKIHQLAIPHAGSPVAPYITMSMGISHVKPNDKIQASQLIEAADKALYAAKSSGRNQWICNKADKHLLNNLNKHASQASYASKGTTGVHQEKLVEKKTAGNFDENLARDLATITRFRDKKAVLPSFKTPDPKGNKIKTSTKQKVSC